METSEQNSYAPEPLTELANVTGNAVLVLNSDIHGTCFREVVASLESLGSWEALSLILNSRGGSIEDAFWITKAIRDQCQKLDVIVPNMAKSAATLISLAADRILLGQFGELGPLDPQVPDPAGNTDFRSPLEMVKGLEFLRTYYIETFDTMVRFLLRQAGMDVAHTLNHATGLLSPIAEPLYRSVNYRDLGEAARHLAVSEEYARETMRRWSPLDEDSVAEIVAKLVWEYPDHRYIIDIDEAVKIGLTNVERLAPDLERLCLAVIYEQELPVIAGAPEDRMENECGDNSTSALGGENGN